MAKETRFVPAHLIPELPDTVRPFSDTDLALRVDFKKVAEIDLHEIFVDGENVDMAVQHLREIESLALSKCPAGSPLVFKQFDRGEYEDYEQYYVLGYEIVETEDEIRARLEQKKRVKLDWLVTKARKATAKEVERARLAALRETTAKTELELVQALAAKHGLTVAGPALEPLTTPTETTK